MSDLTRKWLVVISFFYLWGKMKVEWCIFVVLFDIIYFQCTKGMGWGGRKIMTYSTDTDSYPKKWLDLGGGGGGGLSFVILLIPFFWYPKGIS